MPCANFAFTKRDWFWYLKWFKPAIIPFINSCGNFNLDFLCLAGVGSTAGYATGFSLNFLLEIICF